jgi:hypothetical protein
MTSLRKQRIGRLATLGVEEQPVPGRDDGFAGLYYRGRAFAHFHHDDELDLHLTRSVIAREGMVHHSNSIVHPKRSRISHWIELFRHLRSAGLAFERRDATLELATE